MRHGWAVLAAVLALGASPRPLPNDKLWSRDDEQAKTEARRLYDAGAYAHALPLYNAVLARHPRDIDCRRHRGVCYLQTNQPALALEDFDTLVGQDAGWPEGWTNRGNALLMLGRNEQALEAFQTAIEAHRWWSFRISTRAWAAPYAGLGEAFYQLGRLDLSLQAYEMVRRFDPGNPIGARGRSRALVAMGKAEDALPDANAAVLGNPNALGPWHNRGSDLAAMGRNEEALNDFNEALRRDPSNALTWKSRGGLLVRMGRAEEALRDLNEAIRLNPNLASAYQNRGAAYNCLKQYDKAATDLEKAVKLDPDNVGAHNNLGLALSALGKPDLAVLEFSEAVRLGASNAAVFVNRGLAYERLGVADASASDFIEALRHDPRSSLAKEGLARLQRRDQPPSPAPSGSEMAMPLSGPSFEEILGRSDALFASGDLKGAALGYSEAIAKSPDRAEPYARRALARLVSGKDGGGDDARTFLERTRWAAPESAQVAILGVLADRREGRMADAERLLDEALANTPADRWPHPALLYLRGRLDKDALMASAGSQTQNAEAEALVGLSLGLAGDRQGAVEPLRSAVAHLPKDSGSALGLVAKAALEQVE